MGERITSASLRREVRKRLYRERERTRAADIFREAEFSYYSGLFDRLVTQTDNSPQLLQSAPWILYSNLLHISLAQRAMEKITSDFNFLVGGSDRTQRAGVFTDYDPKKHTVALSPDEDAPLPGERIIVNLSSLSYVNEDTGEEEEILSAVYVPAPPLTLGRTEEVIVYGPEESRSQKTA